MWRRREFYLTQVAPYARMEAFYSELAQDLAGDPRQAASVTATALLPDGSAVHFASHGAFPRIEYPPGDPNPADKATVGKLVAMCQRAAAYQAGLRRKYEYAAAHPWLLVSPDPPPPK